MSKSSPRSQKRHVFHMELRSDGRRSDGNSSDNTDDETFQEAKPGVKKPMYPALPRGDTSNLSRLYPNLKDERADGNELTSRGARTRRNEGSGDGVDRDSKGYEKVESRGPTGASIPNSRICLVCLICLLVIFAYLAVSGSKAKAVPKPPLDPFQEFKSGINTLSAKYPSQNANLVWVVVKAASMRVLMEPDPEDPMILLLAAPKGSGSMATCLAREIAQEFSKARGVSLHRNFYLDGKQINSGRAFEAEKLLLDESMKEVFENGGHALVLDNVQALSGKAAAMLHAYSDNGNAMYRTVLMVFVVHLDDSTKTDQAGVEAFFEQAWSKDIGKMHVMALMVRIANNLVSLVPEPVFEPSQCKA